MTLPELQPRIAPDLVWRLLDDSAVIVSPKSGEVRVFNPMGTTIWQMLVNNEDLPAIEDHLVENYDVTHGRAHEDLQLFVDELIERGILITGDKLS